MYKIYINENLLVLSTPMEIQRSDIQLDTGIPYVGRTSTLLNVVDKLEKNPDEMTFGIYHDDVAKLWKTFRGLYKGIRAAGGFVMDGQSRCLYIERLSTWDLPKGKKDKGEKSKQTAIREVREETGLECSIEYKVGNTWHTYRDERGTRILKRTNWYAMKVIGGQIELQAEEQITDFKWSTPLEFLKSDLPTYRSIRSITSDFLKKMEAQE